MVVLVVTAEPVERIVGAARLVPPPRRPVEPLVHAPQAVQAARIDRVRVIDGPVLERIEEPQKNWKFAPGDVKERAHWNDYMNAYEDAIRATASAGSPWYVVPADNKWFTRLVVVGAIVHALESMHLEYPNIDRAKRKELDEVRQLLLADDRPG